jgi:hypothetical protein
MQLVRGCAVLHKPVMARCFAYKGAWSNQRVPWWYLVEFSPPAGRFDDCVSEAFALVELKAFVVRAGLLSQTSPARLMLHTMSCLSQKLLGMVTRVLAALFPILCAPATTASLSQR